jgi:hypothetical protein
VFFKGLNISFDGKDISGSVQTPGVVNAQVSIDSAGVAEDALAVSTNVASVVSAEVKVFSNSEGMIGSQASGTLNNYQASIKWVMPAVSIVTNAYHAMTATAEHLYLDARKGI